MTRRSQTIKFAVGVAVVLLSVYAVTTWLQVRDLQRSVSRLETQVETLESASPDSERVDQLEKKAREQEDTIIDLESRLEALEAAGK